MVENSRQQPKILEFKILSCFSERKQNNAQKSLNWLLMESEKACQHLTSNSLATISPLCRRSCNQLILFSWKRLRRPQCETRQFPRWPQRPRPLCCFLFSYSKKSSSSVLLLPSTLLYLCTDMRPFNGKMANLPGVSCDHFAGDNKNSDQFFLSHCHSGNN